MIGDSRVSAPLDIGRSMSRIRPNWVEAIRRRFRFDKIVQLDGLRIHVSGDMPRGVRRALMRGDYELSERNIVSQILEPNDRILEVGTGIGVVASLCGQLCSDGTLLCYEANPNLLPTIRKNFALNNVQAELVNRCIGVEDENLEFYFGENFISSSAYNRWNTIKPVSVRADSFSRVVSEFCPSVIVMDIEGSEVSTLHTADLAGVRVIVLEVHPWIVGEDQIAAMFDRLAQMNFFRVNSLSEKNTVLLARKE